MKLRPHHAISLASLLLMPLLVGVTGAARAEGTAAKVTVVYDLPIPNIPGKSMKGILVEYGPGGHSPAHTHAPSAVIYATVLEGAIRSQVNDEPAKVYQAGENFTERPGDHHAISANASTTEPAKLLAVFIVDTNDQELTKFEAE